MKKDKPATEKERPRAMISEKIENPISVSEAKTGFLEFFRQASKGIEIVARNRNTSENVSMLSTPMVSAMLDALKFNIEETLDAELGITTVAVGELPLYGEGKGKEAAIVDLIDAILEYEDIYIEQIDLYSKVDSPLRQAYMLKLIRCGADREAIRKALGV